MYVEVVLFCFDFLEIFEIVGLCVTFFFFFLYPRTLIFTLFAEERGIRRGHCGV